ncbi:MAG: nuclear transport factor 2 family protein [Gammaproteobacteria bacterium]|nr:nuclear transport factor 2 family protein [Gammaproteobacteria bacterium]
MTFLLVGCGVGMTAAQLDASYENALAATAERARGDLGDDPEALAEAVARAQRFFEAVTPERVRELAASTYAEDAYLNDTLAAVQGSAAIEAYFLEAMESADVLRVEFRSTAVDGIDIYVRWRMHMEIPALKGGEPLVSHGVSQFRFDDDLRILLHKDFWDSGSGFYEHVPVLGRVIRRLRPSH